MNKKKIFTRDALMTIDRLTIDQTGAFLLSELERLDPKIHEPLYSYTWTRDVPIRRDVTLGDEVSSFIRETFAAPGNQAALGKNYIAQSTTQIAGVQESSDKTPYPMYPWGIEIAYSVFDLAKAQQTGRPLEARKINHAQLKYQMDMDEIAYIGDPNLKTVYGLLTLPNVTISAASGPWTAATPIDTILSDINTLLYEATRSAGVAVVPTKILMPWKQYNLLITMKVSDAGNVSAIEYLKANNLANAAIGRPLEILPCKWCEGAGAGKTDRMVAYTQDEDYVRMPIVPLLRTPIDFHGIMQSFVYYGTFGGVQDVYPETIRYMDGI